MRQAFFIMSVETNWNNVVNDAANVAAAGDDASPTGLEFLDNILYPNLQQRKEFGQQVALQQMQNNWNSAPNQMELMKKAGINTNLAAQGIAGAGNAPSAGSPNSSVGAGAAGLGAAAQAAGALNEAVNAGVNAYEKISLTDTRKEEMKSNIRNLIAAATHNEWLAYAVSEMLPLQKENQRADTWLKLANFNKACEEKKLISKRINEAQAHIDELNAQANLLQKQGNLVDAEKLRVDAQTASINLDNDKKTWEKNWRETYHYDPNAPVDVALEQAMVNGAGEDVTNAIAGSLNQVGFQSSLGKGQAEGATAYDIAYNTSQGGLAAAIEKMSKDTEFQKELIKAGVKAEETKHVADIILKYLFGLGFSINVGKIGVTNQNP